MTIPARVRLYRMFFGILALIAIVEDYRFNLIVDPEFVSINFLSFFTIESNFFAGIVLLLGAFLPDTRQTSRMWDVVRGAAMLYMVTTGVVYALLLGGLFNPFSGERPWTSSVLHQVIPIVMVVDFVIHPLTNRISMRHVLVWTMYPLLFLAYSLIRGAIVGWYPYGFLSPHEAGGYAGVALISLSISVAFLLLAASLVQISKKPRANRKLRLE